MGLSVYRRPEADVQDMRKHILYAYVDGADLLEIEMARD